MSRTSIVVAGLVVVLGLPLIIFSTQQRTETQQHAAQFNDLNTANEITQTINADGTMGPLTAFNNYSHTFPPPYLGSLNLLVTDPAQSQQYWQYDNSKNSYTRNASYAAPRFTYTKPNSQPWFWFGRKPTPTVAPTGYVQALSAEGSQSATLAGSQTVTSLEITIKKVEVHLSYVGLPGAKNEDITPTPAQKQYNKLFRKTNQELDKWEVLELGNATTLDLIQLANAHSLASLGLTRLVNGRYNEMRLYIDHANAILPDGTKVALVIPGRSNIVRIVRPFAINSDKTTTLTVDFDAQNSVIKAGDSYIFKPVVAKFTNQNDTSK